MKITKYALVVSLITFFIGCVTVIGYFWFAQTKKVSETLQVSVELPKIETLPSNETIFKPEIYDVVDAWEENESKFKVDLLETGENFHGEDIKAKSGEQWLGLFNENGKTFLRFTKVEIKKNVEYIPGGKKPIQAIWKTVIVSDKNQPLFLVKNAKKLRTSEVKTLFYRPSNEEIERQQIETTSLVKGFIQEFQFGGKKYTFRVKEGLTKSDEKSLALVLETEHLSQVIHAIHYNEAGDWVGSLLWIGDLDGDEKLDLYMDFYTYEKGGYSSGLFLSSEAEKDKLVKKVAAFVTQGC